MLYTIEALTLVLRLAIVVVLIRTWLRTRDVAFIWLALATVVWPILSIPLQMGNHALTDRLLRHEPIGVYPFTLVERGEMTIGELIASLSFVPQVIETALLLVAVIYLGKTRGTSKGF
jgi:hypothetical protein